MNHSEHFVDPNTGACTNNVENYWGRAKKQMKIMHGAPDSTLFSHLDEFMWRERHGKFGQTAWDSLLLHISQQYPTP